MNRISPYEIQDIWERLAWAARHLYRLGYVKADVGNFSYKINDEMILIKPKGVSFRGFRTDRPPNSGQVPEAAKNPSIPPQKKEILGRGGLMKINYTG